MTKKVARVAPRVYGICMHTDALLRLSRSLHAVHDLDGLMREVVPAIAAETGYAHAWLSVFTADRTHFELVGNPSVGDERIHQRGATLEITRDRFLMRCLHANEPFVIADLREDPDADPEQVAFFENRTVIQVPMLHLGNAMGTLGVGTFGDAEGVRAPARDELSFIVQVASLISVVVGRLHAEEARSAIEEKMRASQRLEALGQLAGEVAHDFNNMLVSIVGNSDLLARMLAAHPGRELVEEVQEAARRATTLTRQLLAFSRGQLLDRHELDLCALVNDLSRLLTRLLPDDVELVVKSCPGSCFIVGDRGQLDQIIMNLAINARDAMPDGGRLLLEVRAVEVDEDYVATHPWARCGHYLLLSVSDTGVGMSAEVAARIFEPFFTTKAATVGTGLGLAVVDSVLKQHNGFVHVYSEPGVGTTFKLYLPAVTPSGAAPGDAPRDVVVSARGGDEHILAVDDDPHILLYIERLLTGAGYRVTGAENGAQALERLDEHDDIALILTDLVMPVMGGPALIAAAQARPNPPRTLVMTGYARGILADASFRFAITKPFGSQELLQKIREALDAPP